MKPTRRDFLKLSPGLALLPSAAQSCSGRIRPEVTAPGNVVNDVHSQLNRTIVDCVVRPTATDELRATILKAGSQGKAVSVCGRRHAMGGQQFGAGNVLLDLTGMNRVLSFDREQGIIEVEAGIEWPELLAFLSEAQKDRQTNWGIMQKQTGADRLSLGGALAANIHGRGLKFKPLIEQIESCSLLDHTGEVRHCSRRENSELFRLVIGGYGLFGVVTSVRLKLWERRKVQRIVEIRDLSGIPHAFEQRIADGYLYGDFQYATDRNRDSFMRRGVFSCYRPGV